MLEGNKKNISKIAPLIILLTEWKSSRSIKNRIGRLNLNQVGQKMLGRGQGCTVGTKFDRIEAALL